MFCSLSGTLKEKKNNKNFSFLKSRINIITILSLFQELQGFCNMLMYSEVQYY